MTIKTRIADSSELFHGQSLSIGNAEQPLTITGTFGWFVSSGLGRSIRRCGRCTGRVTICGMGRDPKFDYAEPAVEDDQCDAGVKLFGLFSWVLLKIDNLAVLFDVDGESELP